MPIEEIADAEDRLWAALQAADVAELDDLFSPGLTYTDDAGRRIDKEQRLNLHKTGLLSIEKFGVGNRNIRLVMGGAIVTCDVVILEKMNGITCAGTYAYTRVWEWLGCRWRVAAVHRSFIA